jgi:hypothetical protein
MKNEGYKILQFNPLKPVVTIRIYIACFNDQKLGILSTLIYICIHMYVSCIQPTVHELMPAWNASLAAMQCSASGSNVPYYPSAKLSPINERSEQGCYNT